jgi:hypothetical protein
VRSRTVRYVTECNHENVENDIGKDASNPARRSSGSSRDKPVATSSVAKVSMSARAGYTLMPYEADKARG